MAIKVSWGSLCEEVKQGTHDTRVVGEDRDGDGVWLLSLSCDVTMSTSRAGWGGYEKAKAHR